MTDSFFILIWPWRPNVYTAQFNWNDIQEKNSFFIPRRLIFEFSVLGGTPNSAAAPPSPVILPLQYFRMFKICSFSFSSIVAILNAGAADVEVDLFFLGGNSISLMVSPCASNTLRSIRCSISLILPGQLYSINSCKTLLLIAVKFFPDFFENRIMKCSASAGMSSRRFLNGGKLMGKIFKR